MEVCKCGGLPLLLETDIQEIIGLSTTASFTKGMNDLQRSDHWINKHQRNADLKYQYSQQDAEDEDDQEDGKCNEEQNLGNTPRARGDSSETEEASNERDDEEDDGPLDHGIFLCRADVFNEAAGALPCSTVPGRSQTAEARALRGVGIPIHRRTLRAITNRLEPKEGDELWQMIRHAMSAQ